MIVRYGAIAAIAIPTITLNGSRTFRVRETIGVRTKQTAPVMAATININDALAWSDSDDCHSGTTSIPTRMPTTRTSVNKVAKAAKTRPTVNASAAFFSEDERTGPPLLCCPRLPSLLRPCLPRALPRFFLFAIRGCPHQKSALPGVRGNGITSRMFAIPVTNCTTLSRPSPKPACGTVPKRRRSRYHQ